MYYQCPKCLSTIVSSNVDLKIFCSTCSKTLFKKDAKQITKYRFLNIVDFNKKNKIGRSDA